MRHGFRIMFGLAVGLSLLAENAQAQRYYPRGYGGYGWGGWGGGGGGAVDPAGGYMAGLGSYARGQGVYEEEDAKAQAINLDTMLKWNKALRQRQRELREEKAKDDAQKRVERDARLDKAHVADGSTLNDLVGQIYDFDPAATRSSQSRIVIGSSAIREIPFEWDSEAITICMDQMTGQGALPGPLNDPRFAEERATLRRAVETAFKEDAKGNVTAKTQRTLKDAIEGFRTKFVKLVPDFDESYSDSEAYFTTMAGLIPLLHDRSMKKILSELESDGQRTVGDLIAFMHAYNLRFGQATTERQVEIYQELIPMLGKLVDAVDDTPPPPPAPDLGGNKLRSAAKDAFKGLKWNQIKAHDKDPQ